MNEAKLSRAEDGLNTIATKVYEAIPIQEVWTKAQIVSEFNRLGHNASVRIIEGVLDTLRGRGLVTENPRGSFRRVTAKPKIHLIQAKETEVAKRPEMPQEAIDGLVEAVRYADNMTSKDPLTRLAEIASSMIRISGDIKNLAKHLEDAALMSEEKMKQSDESAQKLRQLQALLKGLA